MMAPRLTKREPHTIMYNRCTNPRLVPTGIVCTTLHNKVII